MKYGAGWNISGYLPEIEPEIFDNLADAIDYIHETIERFADEDEVETLETLTVEIGDDYADAWYRDLHFWVEPIERGMDPRQAQLVQRITGR